MEHISSNNIGGGGANAFICTECGHGCKAYSELLSHLVIHGPLDSFSLDGSSNGFDVAREYILHENGTLTVVERSDSLTMVERCDSFEKTPSLTLQKPLAPPVYHSTSRFPEVEPIFKAQMPSLPPVMYGCETCKKSFNSLRNLQKHQQYRKTEEGHKCTLCCKVFSNKEELKGHLQEHAHERFYCCGHCGKRFLRLETLYAHQKERHQSTGIKSVNKSNGDQENSIEKTYPCKKCRLHFFWLSDLQSHSLSHAKVKAKEVTDHHSPEIKVESLLKKKSAERIRWMVSYREPFIDLNNDNDDDDDDAVAPRKGAQSFRPYRCGLCGDRFQQLADLKKHHFSHQSQADIDQTLPKRKKPSEPQSKRGRPTRRKRGSGARLHPCKYCHRAFNHSSSLSRHMRYHKGTLHTCVFCGRHFPQRCDVRRHIAMYHKKELEKKPGLKYKALHTNPEVYSTKSESVTTEHEHERSPHLAEIWSEGEEEEQNASKKSKATKSRLNYKCQECGKSFGLLCVYQRHLRYHKRQDELLKCPHCPSRFRQSSALQRHLKNHPKQLDEEVDVEGGQPSPADSNQDHDQEKDNLEVLEDDAKNAEGDQEASGDVLYECTECTENFSCLQRFLQHQTSHGSDNLG